MSAERLTLRRLMPAGAFHTADPMEQRSALLAIAVGLALGSPAAAQDSRPATSAASEGSPATTHLVLEVGLGRDTISRHIYGQFAEHLGRDIYDGVWTKAGGVPWHLRTDVIDALRRLRVPNVRWPGGCFADYCHWRDGIEPAARRPKMVNTTGETSSRTTASGRTSTSSWCEGSAPSRRWC